MREKVKSFLNKSKGKQTKRRRAISKVTFTKRAVKWLLILGCINGTLPFVLSFFGREPVAEMGVAWITEIVAVILGYLCKSYFETKQERKQELEDFKSTMMFEQGQEEEPSEDSSDEFDEEDK